VELSEMIEEYYELRGWNKKNGLPTKRKLIELGLIDVAMDLEKRGLLNI
jgi:aldehyde:ferredoxin oxidoreductase